MKAPNTLPIAIVGAGLGGLTLGIALRRAGFEVRLFERAPALAEVGAGITLWSNALRALDSLDVGAAVRNVGRIAHGGVIALRDGRHLVDTTARDLDALGPVAELRALHRAELQQALFEQLPAGLVQFDARCTGYRVSGGGATLTFVDTKGQEFEQEAWLAVGADGIHSAMRAELTGDETRYAGYACWRGICHVPPGWGGVGGEIWGVGDRFGVVQLPGERLYWFAVATMPPNSKSAAPKQELLDRFGGYAFDVPAIIEATHPDAIIFRDIIDRPPTPGWSDGSVTLLGDAAHATTPNLGQGAAMAIESAVVLTRALEASESLREALASYERTRWPRTSWVTKTSFSIGRWAHWEGSWARALRNTLFASLPRSTRLAQVRKLVSYDAARTPLLR